MYLSLCAVECLNNAEMELKDNDDTAAEKQVKKETSTDTVNAECKIVSVVKNSQPIRPFLFNADTECDIWMATSSDSKVTCPTCYRDFQLHEIEQHADTCADLFDPVGTVSEVPEIQHDDEESLEELQMVETTEEVENGIGVIENIKAIISTLRPNVDMECTNRVSIRRRYAFQDYLAARRKPNRKFNPKAMLKVNFIGEPAVDDGGPRREFFSEALEQISRRLFRDGTPVVNMAALGNEEFKVAGEIMAASVVQGGPAPCFLSKDTFSYIVYGVESIGATDPNYTVEDIHLKDAIKKLLDCVDEESFKDTLMSDEVFDVLEKVGYRGVPTRETLSSKGAIIRSIVMFEYSRKMPMLDQMIDGLRSFGVLDCIKANSKKLEPVFVVSKAFLANSEVLIDSIVAYFSETGSNSKEKEIDILKFFNDYIEDFEYATSESSGCSLPKLLQFITGAKSMPPLGFPQGISVKFLHGCPVGCKCRPISSTCDLSITLPIHCSGPEEFNSMMSSAIIEGVGFGRL